MFLDRWKHVCSSLCFHKHLPTKLYGNFKMMINPGHVKRNWRKLGTSKIGFGRQFSDLSRATNLWVYWLLSSGHVHLMFHT